MSAKPSSGIGLHGLSPIVLNSLVESFSKIEQEKADLSREIQSELASLRADVNKAVEAAHSANFSETIKDISSQVIDSSNRKNNKLSELHAKFVEIEEKGTRERHILVDQLYMDWKKKGISGESSTQTAPPIPEEVDIPPAVQPGEPFQQRAIPPETDPRSEEERLPALNQRMQLSEKKVRKSDLPKLKTFAGAFAKLDDFGIPNKPEDYSAFKNYEGVEIPVFLESENLRKKDGQEVRNIPSTMKRVERVGRC